MKAQSPSKGAFSCFPSVLGKPPLFLFNTVAVSHEGVREVGGWEIGVSSVELKIQKVHFILFEEIDSLS